VICPEARRAAEGKTPREIKRCLMRYIARTNYRQLHHNPNSHQQHPHPQPVDIRRSILITPTLVGPLALTLTGGNRNDVTQLIPLIEDLHRCLYHWQGRPSTPKSDRLITDRDYDHDKNRRLLRALGITPVIAQRGTPDGSGLGRQRWVGERGFAHLHNFWRLRMRYERDPDPPRLRHARLPDPLLNGYRHFERVLKASREETWVPAIRDPCWQDSTTDHLFA
jgi:transposase